MNISLKEMQEMRSYVVKESLNSVTVFWLEQDALLNDLYKKSQALGKSNSNIVKVVLFGSLAKKRAVPGSDADILIILKDAGAPFVDRIMHWKEKFNLDFPCEVFPYTEKEVDIQFVASALKAGIVLFERKD